MIRVRKDDERTIEERQDLTERREDEASPRGEVDDENGQEKGEFQSPQTPFGSPPQTPRTRGAVRILESFDDEKPHKEDDERTLALGSEAENEDMFRDGSEARPYEDRIIDVKARTKGQAYIKSREGQKRYENPQTPCEKSVRSSKR